MTAPVVAVLDYGSGNVHSAVKALAAAGADARLTADRGLIRDAAGLVVPGVGAFSAVIEALRAIRGDELIGRRLAVPATGATAALVRQRRAARRAKIRRRAPVALFFSVS